MTFGFSTLTDLLSWIAIILLTIKLLATIILLRRDRATWFETRHGAWLWWASKITPLIAVPCVIAAAMMQQQVGLVWLYGALMVFVLIAVPVKIWLRFGRKAGA